MNAFRVASRFFESHYRNLVARMSPEEAKKILGFPPRSNPTPDEIKKVYRQMSFANHPDRGGDPSKMALINAAKDVLSGENVWRPEPAPPPPPPVTMTLQEAREFLGFAPDFQPTPDEIFGAYINRMSQDRFDPTVKVRAEAARKVLLDEEKRREKPRVPGNTWEQAQAALPTGVSWKLISEATLITSREHPWVFLWLLYGEKDGKGYVAGVTYQEPSVGVFDVPGKGRVMLDESWNWFFDVMPAGADVAKKLPAYLKSLLSGWTTTNNIALTFPPPKKWFGWPEGTQVTDKTIKGTTRGRGISLKDALIGAGIGGAGAESRKAQVQVRINFNQEKARKLRLERLEQRKPIYSHEGIDVTVILNGKEFKLSDESIANLGPPAGNFFPDVIRYDDIRDNRTWNLTAMRGSRFKADAGRAIQILADALTNEPSTLLLGLYAAAEAYEPKVKRATLRALVASMPLESVSILTGESMFNLFYSL